MKKIISLALAAGLLVGASAQAQAAEFKPSAVFMTTLGASQIGDADLGFNVNYRAQVGLDFIASDNVKANVTMRLPNNATWGNATYGDNDNQDIYLLNAYMQFPVLMFDVKAGLQANTFLPRYMGSHNPVLDDWATLPSFVATADFGMVKPTISYVIPSSTGNLASPTGKENVIALTLPIAVADGIKVSPWALVNYNSEDGKDNMPIYAGLTADANIGNITAGIGGIFATDDGASNMLFTGNVAMNLGALTPGVAVWYGMSDSGPEMGHTKAIGSSGWWGGFNGSTDVLYANQGSLANQYFGKTDAMAPTDSLGVTVNVNNIAVGEKARLGAHVMYVMDTRDVAEASKKDAQLDAGVKFTMPFATQMTFVATGNYIIVNEDTNAITTAFTARYNF